MFAIESYFKNRKAKIDAWKAAGKVWLKQGDGYYRRVLEDYEIEHPYPVIMWSRVAARLAPVALGLSAIGLVVLMFALAPEPKKDANNPNGCDVVVKKGDKVAVQSGSFDGSEGTVIQQSKGCDVDLRLTKSTYTFATCRAQTATGYCDKTKEIDTVLNVDRNGKIIKL